jgi:hypothetical protein
MNEERTNEEQPTFKVADRRKFNLDGSPREGVQFEESKPKPESAPTQINAEPAISQQPQMTDAAENNNSEPEIEIEAEADDEILDESQIPGAENPASFANFLLSLASQAAAALGLAENPMTGQRRPDLELSRYWLDVLGMLREKTKGNLHPQEQKLFDGLLGDLRIQYLQLARAAEAQLKKQAAQKFSGKDILGK